MDDKLLNEKLRQARKDRAWSIEEAASRIGVSRTTYMRWEQRTQIPHGSTLRDACNAFHMSAEQLGFKQDVNTSLASDKTKVVVPRFISSLSQSVGPDMLQLGITALLLARQQNGWSLEELSYRAGEEMKKLGNMTETDQSNMAISRRDVLKFLIEMPVAYTGLATSKGFQSSPLSEEDLLPLYIAGIPVCWRLYYDGNLDEVEKVLPSYIQHLTPFAQQDSKYLRTTAGVTSQAYQIATLIAKHHEDFGTALTYCKQSAWYGKVANDPNLIVSSLIRQVDVLFYRKRFSQAFEALKESECYASQVTPLLRGRIFSELAPAYAKIGQEQDADRYMGMAHDITPDNPEDDPGYSFTHSNHYINYLNDTLSFLYIQKPKNALKAITEASKYIPNNINTQRMEVLSYQTICSIALNDMEQSIAHFYDLAEAGRLLGSVLFSSEIHDVFQQMQVKWPQEKRVQTLAELIRG